MARILTPDHWRSADEFIVQRGGLVVAPDRTIRVAAAVHGVSGVRAACEGGVFGGVAVYLDGWAGAGLSTPPGIAWELRARYGNQGAALRTGVLSNLATLESGCVVRVTGCLAEGFELWARVTSGAVPITVQVRWMLAPASAGGPFEVTDGELV